MSNHSTETDVILGPKADMEKMYSLLKAIPDSFDYAGTMMKAFSGDPNYAAVAKYTLAENGTKVYANDGYFDIEQDVRLCNAELCDSNLVGLFLLSVSSLNFGGNGWDPILFMNANKIDYLKLVELGQSEYDPSAQYWFVRDNVANKEESTTLYDLEMMTYLGGKPPAPDDPRVTKKPGDFIQAGIDLFKLLR
jgi:hypothetical protein